MSNGAKPTNVSALSDRVCARGSILHIVDRGLIYDADQAAPAEQVSCFPSLVQLQSGTWLASFQVGPEKHSPTANIRLARSTSDGASWQVLDAKFATTWQGVPGSLISAELVETHSGRVLLMSTWYDRKDPQKPLHNPVSGGILPSRQLKAFSDDEGDTWSEWEEVPIAGLCGCAATGPLLAWSDGKIAFPYESFKAYDELRPIPHGAWMLCSEDGGRTFGPPIEVVRSGLNHIQFWDQRLCCDRRPGEFIGMFWTHDARLKKDLTVHACRGRLLEGQGATIAIWQTSIPGQIAAPLLLPSGLWLALVIDRRKPAAITLWVSSDDGRTWPVDQSIVVHQHQERAAVTQGIEDVNLNALWEDFCKWSFGHPAIRSMNDDSVLLSYYAGTPDRMSIHWAHVVVNR
jgi:hypothetical protein